MDFPRASGILLHPTSLPGRFGIGDLGPEARKFVDFLVQARQTYWQILPLSPTGYGDSPYSSISAFAGNTLLISPERLAEDGLLDRNHIEQKPDFPADHVDFGWVYEWKTWMLLTAYESFRAAQNHDLDSEFATFSAENAWWLDDFSLYRAIKSEQGQKPWFEWNESLKLRDGDALASARQDLGVVIDAEKFYQFLFFRQWLALKEYANAKGIRIIGDVPIFVALDSVDVWCNQSKFKLEEDGSPRVVSGVPPDYFSSTGQRWGNPIYDWDAMLADNFGWWIARMRFALSMVDIVRIDHFIGFARMWEVPAGDETAENGEWVDVPGGELFSALNTALGDLPFIAEDLGAVTSEVEHLRDSFGIPGMKILQYAFGGDPNDGYLPHNYVRNCVAYTGTHDNETSVGWYRAAAKQQRSFCRNYVHSNGREVHWDMIRAIAASVADTSVVPMQDILGLGNEARMNTPATGGPNWQWRLVDGQLGDDITEKLGELTEIYGRANKS